MTRVPFDLGASPWLLLALLVGASLAGCSSSGIVIPTETPPLFVQAWGDNGGLDGQFNVLTGVAVDAAGNVYATDSANHRIEKFSSAGVFLTKWGSQGSANGQMKFPSGIAVNPAGTVYVIDSTNKRIESFTSTGSFLAKWGSSGTADGQFKMPRGIAVAPNGDVYVADAMLHRVQRFTSAGVFISKWGASGTANGQFHEPRGVAVDGAGYVYVADYANDRVQKFDANGTFVLAWGGHGTDLGKFDKPYGVAVDATGDVYVTDVNNHRVQKFTNFGAFLSTWGTHGSDDGEFDQPFGIAVNATRTIFVVDGGNDRLEKFRYRDPNTVDVAVTVDGVPWSGPIGLSLVGPQSVTGAVAPYTSPPLAAGTYSVSAVSGGPPLATLLNTSVTGPTALVEGGVASFRLDFSSPTDLIVNATLDGAPWSGPLNTTLTGIIDYYSFTTVHYSTTVAPQLVENVTNGVTFFTDPLTNVSGPAIAYFIAYNAGGPPGASLASIAPNSMQTLFTHHTQAFTLNFLSPGVTANSIVVNATLDGAPWSGPVSFQVQGVTSFSPFVPSPVYVGAAAPQAFSGVAVGTQTFTDPVTAMSGPGAFYAPLYLSGGPPGAAFAGIAPAPYQVLVQGGAKAFTLQFVSLRPVTGTVVVKATLDGVPWSGPANTTLTGPQTLSGSTFPLTHANVTPGSYALSVTGVPPGVGFVGASPAATQGVTAGNTTTYTLAFRSKAAGGPGSPSGANGTVVVEAKLTGAAGVTNWTGPLNFSVSGPLTLLGANVGQIFVSAPAGNYTFHYTSGGPPNATLAGVSPAVTQTLGAGGTITFRLEFREG